MRKSYDIRCRHPQSSTSGVAAVLVTILCWTYLSIGMTAGLIERKAYAAHMVYGGNPLVELRIARLSDDAAVAKNVENASSSDPNESNSARSQVDAALRMDPLSVESFLQLGRVGEKSGKSSFAKAAYLEAYRRSFREIGATANLLQSAYAEGDINSTVQYLDALLRVRPDLGADMLPLLATAMAVPAARQSLAKALAVDPIWRQPFLLRYGELLYAESGFIDIIDLMKESARPVRKTEVSTLLTNLISRGKIDEALTIWFAIRSDNIQNGAPLLNNGRFVEPINDIPFNWYITNSENAKIAIVDALAGVEGKALEIEFLARRGVFMNVSQITAMPPGNYRLSGKVRTDQFRNARGVQWKIFCGVGAERMIGETERIRGEPGGWRTFSSAFSVTGKDCTSQMLRLELAARIGSEQIASGTVWFADLTIDRVD